MTDTSNESKTPLADAAEKLFAGLEKVRTTDGQGKSGYAMYFRGTLPLVISVPHGGYLRPSDCEDRKTGVFDNDILTQELADAIRLEFERRFGAIPHIIVNKLARKKLDANRNVDDAAQGSKPAIAAWEFFQASIESAKQQVLKTYKCGFHMDLHGQSHDKRIQLGYLTRGADLDKCSDGDIDRAPQNFRDKSSVRTLATRLGFAGGSSSGGASGDSDKGADGESKGAGTDSAAGSDGSSKSAAAGDSKIEFSDLLRGEASLGALFEAAGYPAVPSPKNPTTGGTSYFNGGYNTLRHGSQSGGAIDSIQAELANVGLRDTQENRAKFAKAYCSCLVAFLKRHYFPDSDVFAERGSKWKVDD